MNAGEKVIEWLYTDQLKVDPEWSIRTPTGFTWWADKNAQTIEIIGEQNGPERDKGYLISVRTEFLCDLALTDQTARVINQALMTVASMAGPVYDEQSRTLSLRSLVRVDEGTFGWLQLLISVAAVLQIHEARTLGNSQDFGAEGFAKALGAEEALTGHPKNGVRPTPDELTQAVAGAIAEGRKACKWREKEFRHTVDSLMQQPPSLGTTSGGPGFTVEFPYGSGSSICQALGDQPHPRYGNGLRLLQSFPVSNLSETDGAKLALSLNATELAREPFGYGFGSYCYVKETSIIRFTSFWPNLTYRKGLLPNIYFACAKRARSMAVRLMKSDWTEESLTESHSAVERSLAETPKKRRKPAKRSPDQALLDALASLTMDDVPALEQLLIIGLVAKIPKVQHDGLPTDHDGAAMVGQLNWALIACQGKKPERQPAVTDAIAAYRNVLVAGAHSIAPRGEKGLAGLVVRGAVAAKGELEKGRGDLDSQVRGVYQWLMLALAAGYPSSSVAKYAAGVLASFAGWSEILRGATPSFFPDH